MKMIGDEKPLCFDFVLFFFLRTKIWKKNKSQTSSFSLRSVRHLSFYSNDVLNFVDEWYLLIKKTNEVFSRHRRSRTTNEFTVSFVFISLVDIQVTKWKSNDNNNRNVQRIEFLFDIINRKYLLFSCRTRDHQIIFIELHLIIKRIDSRKKY